MLFCPLPVGQEVIAAKQCWKELKAGYQAGVAALTEAAPGALAQFNRAQCQAQCLQDALTRHQHQVGAEIPLPGGQGFGAGEAKARVWDLPGSGHDQG